MGQARFIRSFVRITPDHKKQYVLYVRRNARKKLIQAQKPERALPQRKMGDYCIDFFLGGIKIGLLPESSVRGSTVSGRRNQKLER
jgi:hypothetical protein